MNFSNNPTEYNLEEPQTTLTYNTRIHLFRKTRIRANYITDFSIYIYCNLINITVLSDDANKLESPEFFR